MMGLIIFADCSGKIDPCIGLNKGKILHRYVHTWVHFLQSALNADFENY
jgi:hypothetical protein